MVIAGVKTALKYDKKEFQKMMDFEALEQKIQVELKLIFENSYKVHPKYHELTDFLTRYEIELRFLDRKSVV